MATTATTQATQNIQTLVNMIKADVKGKNLTVATIVPILIQTMETVENFSVAGETKQQIVVTALNAVIDDTVTDKAIAGVLKEIIPAAIEAVIKLSQNGFYINQTKTCCLSIFSCCKK